MHSSRQILSNCLTCGCLCGELRAVRCVGVLVCLVQNVMYVVMVCSLQSAVCNRQVIIAKNVFLFIITLNDPAGSRQQLAAPPPAPATSMKDERRATSDQDELRKQGSGRPQAGGERCLRSANSPLGRRCAGENHVFVRLAWIPISVCCLLHHPHFCWLGVAEYM